jgi:predicted nucleic acid-binding protein
VNRQILVDTGPLVALLNRRDHYHAWAAAQWTHLQPPLLTCEPVLTEACFLLRSAPRGSRAVVELVQRGILKIDFRLDQNVEAVSRLLAKYASLPMSLADACLVRMAEARPQAAVMTLDSDFRLYRKPGRQVIPLISPDTLLGMG